MFDLLMKMREIKINYNKTINKILSLKTKKTQEKYFITRDNYCREFKLLQYDLDYQGFDISKLNLTIPASGPWHLRDAHSFNLETPWYFSFKFKGDETKYVGEFSLLEDKCGIDNLDIMIKQLL